MQTKEAALATHSRLKDARRCRRLHWIQYHQMIRPVREEETLRFGTLMHKALEAWWRNYSEPDGIRVQLALAAIDDAKPEPFERAKARVLMFAYHARWKGEPFEVLGVEMKFGPAPLINPATGAASRNWKLGGKLDVLVRDLRTGLVFVIEHKTTAENFEPGSGYVRRLRLDGQVSIYFEGGRILGHAVDGCIYDVIGKPAQRPLKATPIESRKYRKDNGELYANQRAEDETPDEYEARIAAEVIAKPNEYLARVDVVRLEQEMKDAMLDVWQLTQELREAELAGRAPRNPDACQSFNRTCAFFDVCTGAASLDDPTLFKRLDDVHPELKEEAA